MKRTENGVAILRTPAGREAVALDVVAKLSGVNLGAVSKVFAALKIVSDATALPVPDLIQFEDMPLAAPDQERAEATNEFCERLGEFQCKREEGLFLKLSHRLNRPVN